MIGVNDQIRLYLQRKEDMTGTITDKTLSHTESVVEEDIGSNLPGKWQELRFPLLSVALFWQCFIATAVFLGSKSLEETVGAFLAFNSILFLGLVPFGLIILVMEWRKRNTTLQVLADATTISLHKNNEVSLAAPLEDWGWFRGDTRSIRFPCYFPNGQSPSKQCLLLIHRKPSSGFYGPTPKQRTDKSYWHYCQATMIPVGLTEQSEAAWLSYFDKHQVVECM